MPTTFTLPELGENIEFGTVTKILVAVGDTISKDQSVIELETDKAVVEVPSPASGTIVEIQAKEGEDLRVGDTVLILSDGAAVSEAAPSKKEPAQKSVPPPVVPLAKTPATEAAAKPSPTSAPVAPDSTTEDAPPQRRAAASPTVRRLAREIGIDLNQVTPSDKSGRISVDDVKAHARRIHTDMGGGQSSSGSLRGTGPLPDFERWGTIERQKMTTVRKRTAERMAGAWQTIPHVTQHDKADITDLEKLRKEHGHKAEALGGKLTPTAILVKVLAAALKKFPNFNCSLDEANGELIYKNYYNIGVAVDTDRGLLVPVIKDVDTKNVLEVSVELSRLAQRARDRKATLDEMQGGCITITNLGGIGGHSFTPIVNAPEVAILGVSRGSLEPVYRGENFVPRMMLPLSLSYDHRVIDGADAARFTRWICDAIEQPFLLFLEG